LLTFSLISATSATRLFSITGCKQKRGVGHGTAPGSYGSLWVLIIGIRLRIVARLF